MTRIGWRLTLEPEGKLLAWSLIRVDDECPDGDTWGGLRKDATALIDLVGRLTDPHDPWRSLLSDPLHEAEAARELGFALLPEPLRRALTDENKATHTVTIATRGWLSRVPWEALAVGWDGTRLVERAVVLAGLSPALVVTLRRPPAGGPRGEGQSGRLWVIDPGPPTGEFGPLFPAGPPRALAAVARASGALLPDAGTVGPSGLATALAGRAWASLVYLGHLRGAPEGSPAASALVLSDGAVSAFLTARDWLAEPGRWPAPPRTALIGCSGDDAGAAEQSGLVVAALNAGATLVTTTRWALPNEPATARLALAVALAQDNADPVGALRRWQLLQLQRWRNQRSRDSSPLLWASLVSYDVDRLRGEAP